MSLAKRKIDYEFLPSALEIEEKPSPPLGRIFLWLLLLLLVLLVIWAYLGKIDIVTTSRGKIIPDGNVKTVQTLNGGVVNQVFVKEGRQVKKGDPLIRLDSTITRADKDNLQKQIAKAEFEKQLIEAELDGENIEKAVGKVKDKNLDESYIKLQKEIRTKSIEHFKTQVDILTTAINQANNQVSLSKETLKNLEDRLTTLEKEEQEKKKLLEQGKINSMEWENKRDRVLTLKNQIDQQKFSVNQANMTLTEANSNLISFKQQHQSELLTAIKEKANKISSLSQEVIKFKKEEALATITAPIDGKISTFKNLLEGSVLSPSETVGTIVPVETKLIAEAEVANKDIGYIDVNQRVEVKLDTYPFQKYSYIKGKVEYISPNAIIKEDGQSVYKVLIKLNNNFVERNNQKYYLSPGMTASIDIKTGKRRIIDFFLSPLKRHLDESLSLR